MDCNVSKIFFTACDFRKTRFVNVHLFVAHFWEDLLLSPVTTLSFDRFISNWYEYIVSLPFLWSHDHVREMHENLPFLRGTISITVITQWTNGRWQMCFLNIQLYHSFYSLENENIPRFLYYISILWYRFLSGGCAFW